MKIGGQKVKMILTTIFEEKRRAMIYILVLIISFLLDYLWAKCVFSTSALLPLKSSIYSGLLVLLSSISTIIVVDNHYTLIPIVLGHMSGSFTAVYYMRKKIEK